MGNSGFHGVKQRHIGTNYTMLKAIGFQCAKRINVYGRASVNFYDTPVLLS